MAENDAETDDTGYPDEDVEYPDDVDPDVEQWEDELAEEEKPQPMAFADEYAAPPPRPVELVVPRHAEAFKVIPLARERRFPAKRVAQSALALARALRAKAASSK
jgi:hypothetical protein